MSAAADVASSMVSKSHTATAVNAGRGCSRSVASVTMPNCPSELTNSDVRSKLQSIAVMSPQHEQHNHKQHHDKHRTWSTSSVSRLPPRNIIPPPCVSPPSKYHPLPALRFSPLPCCCFPGPTGSLHYRAVGQHDRQIQHTLTHHSMSNSVCTAASCAHLSTQHGHERLTVGTQTQTAGAYHSANRGSRTRVHGKKKVIRC